MKQTFRTILVSGEIDARDNFSLFLMRHCQGIILGNKLRSTEYRNLTDETKEFKLSFISGFFLANIQIRRRIKKWRMKEYFNLIFSPVKDNDKVHQSILKPTIYDVSRLD